MIFAFFRFIKEHIQPHVQTEEQLLFACHLIGPFLQRCKPEQLFELTVSLKEMLEQVDKPGVQLNYMDPVCDLLYPFVEKYLLILTIEKLKLVNFKCFILTFINA